MDKNLKAKYVKVLEYEQSQGKKYKELITGRNGTEWFFLFHGFLEILPSQYLMGQSKLREYHEAIGWGIRKQFQDNWEAGD